MSGLMTLQLRIHTKPIKYGLPASPNACEINIWKASAVERRVGKTTYCKREIVFIMIFAIDKHFDKR